MMSELISLFSVCDAWGQRSITIFGTLCCTSLLYSMCSCLKFSIFLPLVTENLLKQNCMRGNIWLCWLSKFIMHRRHGSINNFSLTIELKLIVDGCNFFYINSESIYHWQNVRNSGPIFEQNASTNFKLIFKKSVNFGRIFKKRCKFQIFCQW